jgi:hypothetical protein
MNQVVVTIHALQLIPRSGEKHRPVGPHGPPALGHVKKVAVTLLALGILEGGISGRAGFFTVVLPDNKVNRYVLDTVIRFGEKEIEGVLRCREMAIHAVHHHAGGVVGMG